MAEAILTTNGALRVNRRAERFASDDHRVLARFFEFGGEERSRSVIERVLALPEGEVDRLIADVLKSFSSRHRRIELIFERHFSHVSRYVSDPHGLSHNRRMLIGAYFTMEYAIESAALFNPSITPHVNQSGLAEGELRFVMSLRATGEGHVSSIVFRTGTICCDGSITFDPVSRYAVRMRQKTDQVYNRNLMFQKLVEMNAYTRAVGVILAELPDEFTIEQLDHAIQVVERRPDRPEAFDDAAQHMRWLARSNYQLELPPDAEPSDIVIFPTSENESRGIEDLRLTRFTDDDGSVTWYGTYSAYNGYRVLPQLMATRDFQRIDIHTLNGQYAQNKGMALFPRKIGGQYCMISRIDGENMFVMRSRDVYFWNHCQKLTCPRHPWEFVQVGNCGAPIETEAGWVVITHGVGPMRQYCIGAMLLDLDDPSKVIGSLEQPMLVPNDEDRDGYVPNVVYSCGGLVHQDTLYLPYAVNDSYTTVATLSVSELIDHLRRGAKPSTCADA